MTDQERAVMQQALEDLKDLHKNHNITCAGTIAALEAALAQQAEPVEPVEPVAEARYDGTLRWLEPHGVGLHRIQGPLFTAPPPRKPLTDEEIEFCRQQGYAHVGLSAPFDFGKAARAIERAHGITDPQIADRLARHGIPMPGDDDGNPSF